MHNLAASTWFTIVGESAKAESYDCLSGPKHWFGVSHSYYPDLWLRRKMELRAQYTSLGHWQYTAQAGIPKDIGRGFDTIRSRPDFTATPNGIHLAQTLRNHTLRNLDSEMSFLRVRNGDPGFAYARFVLF
jgi:hypothetical protein